MSRTSGFVEVGEAARLLAVTRRYVAGLASAGEVTYVGRGLVDVASVHAYLSQRADSRSRPWSEATAWAAIAQLAGDDVGWLGRVLAWMLILTSLGIAGAPQGQLDGYLGTHDLERLEKDLGFLVDSRGLMILRTTDFEFDVVAHLACEEHRILAALDAAGSLDPASGAWVFAP